MLILCLLSREYFFFFYKLVELCQRISQHILRWTYAFIFEFVNIVYHIDWFGYINQYILKNPTILGIKSTWSWCMSFLICCFCLLKFCWGYLNLCSSVKLAHNFFFFLNVWHLWFSYHFDGGLIEWIWELSFLCNFLEEFE